MWLSSGYKIAYFQGLNRWLNQEEHWLLSQWSGTSSHSLGLQFQGIEYPFLGSVGTRYKRGPQTCIQAKGPCITHKIKYNLLILEARSMTTVDSGTEEKNK